MGASIYHNPVVWDVVALGVTRAKGAVGRDQEGRHHTSVRDVCVFPYFTVGEILKYIVFFFFKNPLRREGEGLGRCIFQLRCFRASKVPPPESEYVVNPSRASFMEEFLSSVF